VPDAGGTWFLVKRVGMARALGAAMLGDRLSAQDAKDWGMIWDVAPEGTDCLTMAMEVAQRLALMPTLALVETRHALRGAAERELDAQLDVERDVQSMLSRTHDYTEGVTAFLAKRTPQFKGN
jgi:2-(1,2-epoxy-1,2-dihydrophenyl)acetyl-CoA isomerase